MAIEAGQELLHYRLVEKIGEGGMGIVWRAVDTTLDREVAIKFLPEAIGGDHERLARFDREAKLLASLNHPNIAGIYGAHEVDGVRFLVMELVEGEDLAERLARGPIPVDEAVELAREIASALETAHEAGVIHRDLKPANVKLTPGGQVKVLDFGLAKALSPATPSGGVDPATSPTLTSVGTVAGMILGTAAYMSPEQARGHAADTRSDIWAFGVVLYEMLTGARSFAGETVSDTLAAVLKTEPDWDRLPAGIPAGIRRLLRRCLAKDPRRRLHAAADARIEIDDALAAAEAEFNETPGSSAISRTSRWLVAALAAIALAAGAVLGWALRPVAPEPPTRRWMITAPDPATEPESPVISPDGRRIAYLLGGKLMIRDLDQVAPRTVAGVGGASHPFWSPDSTQIAYFVGDKLWRVPAIGGQPTRICDVDEQREGAWGNDDAITLLSPQALYRVSARGGDVEKIYEVDYQKVIDLHGLDLLPGGAIVVAAHYGDDTWGIEVWNGDRHHELLRFAESILDAPRWVDTGFIVYARRQTNRGVWALPYDPAADEATGDAFLVTPDGDEPSVSRDGTLVHLAARSAIDEQLVWVSATGEVGAAIGQPQSGMWNPSLSPDGKHVLVAGQEDGKWDLWVHDAVRGTKTRLTRMKGLEGQPTWSVDAKEVFFFNPVFGLDQKIYRMPADGRGEPEEVTSGAFFSLSASGDMLVTRRVSEETKGDLWTVPVDSGEQARVFVQSAADEDFPRFSPNGDFVVYTSDESGRQELYVKPFPSGEGKWQVSIDGGRWGYWSRDGKRLYFVSKNGLYRVNVTIDRGLKLSTPEKLFDGDARRLQLWRGFDVGPEGEAERFVAVQVIESEKGKDPDEASKQRGIFVVENWLDSVER